MPRNSKAILEESQSALARADIPPNEGYSVEVDGKLKENFDAYEPAFDAGMNLKKRFPFIQVRIYDAKEKTRTQITLPQE